MGIFKCCFDNCNNKYLPKKSFENIDLHNNQKDAIVKYNQTLNTEKHYVWDPNYGLKIPQISNVFIQSYALKVSFKQY